VFLIPGSDFASGPLDPRTKVPHSLLAPFSLLWGFSSLIQFLLAYFPSYTDPGSPPFIIFSPPRHRISNLRSLESFFPPHCGLLCNLFPLLAPKISSPVP